MERRKEHTPSIWQNKRFAKVSYNKSKRYILYMNAVLVDSGFMITFIKRALIFILIPFATDSKHRLALISEIVTGKIKFFRENI